MGVSANVTSNRFIVVPFLSLRSAAQRISREEPVMHDRSFEFGDSIHLNSHDLTEDYVAITEEDFIEMQIQRFSHC
jgi:hypothetical protein